MAPDAGRHAGPRSTRAAAGRSRAGPARQWGAAWLTARLGRACGAALVAAALLPPLTGPTTLSAGDNGVVPAARPARMATQGDLTPFAAPPGPPPQAAACASAESCAVRTQPETATRQRPEALQVAGQPSQTESAPTPAAGTLSPTMETAVPAVDTASQAASAPDQGGSTAGPAPGASSQGADAAGQAAGAAGATGDVQACPGGLALASSLRTRWEAGALVVAVRQSALAALAPNPDALRQLVARLRGGEPIEAGDALGWLLTRREAPRYPDNPYVRLTRALRQGESGGASYEGLLATRIAASEGDLQPQDVLQQALDVSGGDYPLATLVAHNLLKELAFASRDGTDVLLGWRAADTGSAADASAAGESQYVVWSAAELADLVGRLAVLRPADDPRVDDRLGPWYHLFGMLFVGALVGGPTPFGPETDLLATWFQPDSAPDPFQEQVTACGTRLAALVAGLAPPAAAPAPASGRAALATAAAVPVAPPPAGVTDPAGALASPFAAPGAIPAAPASGITATGGATAPGAAPGAVAPSTPTPAPSAPFAAVAAVPGAVVPPPPAPVAGAAPVTNPGPVASTAFIPTPFPYQQAMVAQPQAPPSTPLPTPTAVAAAPGIGGVVRNAQTGQPLAGATVSVTSAGRTATADASGAYLLTGLTPGVVQVSATAAGFIPDSASVTIPPSGTATQNFALSQSLAGGQVRIVLTWSNAPRDLDAVLYLPGSGSNNAVDAYTRTRPGATLDTDDRDGGGPETITISQPSPGLYTYAVHQYSNDGTLAASNARVRVLRGDADVVPAFTVPSGAPNARWWTVFTLDGAAGTITPVNTMSSQPPVPR